MSASSGIAEFRECVEAHRVLLRKRGTALSTESIPPVGQAADWYWEIVRCIPAPSAVSVARQIARLCGEDSEVTIPWRSLADAVGVSDGIGRTVAYTQSGVAVLKRSGWLDVVVEGKGCRARTTFLIMPGDREPVAERLDLLPVLDLAEVA